MHPDRIGPWRIERKIGSGGMGTVYFGRHSDTGAEAAVKVLAPAMAREPGFVARFTREIDALRRLASPHVVTLYDSGVDGETHYYSMEYVEGETLTLALRRERRLPWRQAVEFAMQICSALKAAHDAGVIHRDLKPSNLMIAREGTVKLADFGVAQVFAASRLTLTGGIIGTVDYMSPEQAQGQRVTRKSDLYSLGAVLYAMLTGRPPFTGRTNVEVIHKHKYGQFDKPRRYASDVPIWLEDIVCQLLEKDPDKRIPDAYVLMRRLQDGLALEDRLLSDRTAGPDGAFDAGAPTVALERDPGAGPGTMMREFVKAEVERAQQPSPVGAFFNNTWVLLAALVLLVLGGVSWFRERALTPQERFEAGAALMAEPEGDAWLRARDDYFLPLLESGPEEWGDRVQPYLDRIALHELKRPAARRRPSARSAAEPIRLLRLAQHHRDNGDVAGAERIAEALVVLLEDRTGYAEFRAAAAALLEEIQAERADSSDRDEFLRAALDRAESFAQDGRSEEACRIWESVLSLYGDDPGASAWTRRARAGLAGAGVSEPAPTVQSGEAPIP